MEYSGHNALSITVSTKPELPEAKRVGNNPEGSHTSLGSIDEPIGFFKFLYPTVRMRKSSFFVHVFCSVCHDLSSQNRAGTIVDGNSTSPAHFLSP